jgi:hypothetical protein
VTLRSLGNKGTFGVSKDGLNVIESGHKREAIFYTSCLTVAKLPTPRA